MAMEDRDVLTHFEKLVHEEHHLKQLAYQGTLTPDQRTRIQEVELYLDQCWDLLRQRRARRIAGLDPADARLHDIEPSEYFAQ